jgi:tetratricopeptide (TPR) repeat protein
MPLIGALLALFKVWMLVDALQRGCGRGGCGGMYWYWLILMPFGDFAYFFVVKIHDPEFAALRKKLFVRPASLEQIRYEAEHNPCVANKERLALALCDEQQFSEAHELWENLLKQDPRNKNYLYGQALCRYYVKDTTGAREALEILLAIDPDFRDYEAAMNLVKIYREQKNEQKAIEFLEALQKKSHHLQLRMELARSLADTGKRTEATILLERALLDYQHLPGFSKTRDKPFAKEAKVLLNTLKR